METDFHRIKRLPPYVFAEVNALKAAARAAGEDIIDLGMGNPDQPPPPHVIAKLAETLADPRVHRYSNSRGIPGLRHLATGDIFRSLDPNSELGRKFREYSSRGELVPDDITIRIWEDHVRGMIASQRFDPARDVLRGGVLELQGRIIRLGRCSGVLARLALFGSAALRH